MFSSSLVPEPGKRDWEGIIKRFGFLLLWFLLDISLVNTVNKKQGLIIFLICIHYKICLVSWPYFPIISIKAVANIMPNVNNETTFKNKWIT